MGERGQRKRNGETVTERSQVGEAERERERRERESDRARDLAA